MACEVVPSGSSEEIRKWRPARQLPPVDKDSDTGPHGSTCECNMCSRHVVEPPRRTEAPEVVTGILSSVRLRFCRSRFFNEPCCFFEHVQFFDHYLAVVFVENGVSPKPQSFRFQAEELRF